MTWVFLVFAGIFEVVWAYTMKLSNGFTRLSPSILTIIFMLASFTLLSISMKSLPLGTAYTVWVGIGATGAFLVGIFILNEPITFIRILAAILIIIGVILIKIAS